LCREEPWLFRTSSAVHLSHRHSFSIQIGSCSIFTFQCRSDDLCRLLARISVLVTARSKFISVFQRSKTRTHLCAPFSVSE
jgi:hypothetical protein